MANSLIVKIGDRLKDMGGSPSYDNIFERIFIKQIHYGMIRRMRPGTTVITIGASIGDTPIYFAQFNDVVKVIGFEPDPKRLAIAQRNVQMSPFNNKIVLSKDIISNKADKVFDTYSDVLKTAVANGSKIRNVNEILNGLKTVAIHCNVETDIPGKDSGEESIFTKDTNLEDVYQMEVIIRPGSSLGNLLQEKGFEVETEKYSDKALILKAHRK